MIFYFLIGLLAAGITFSALFMVYKTKNGKTALWQKIFAIVLYVLFFFRYLWAKGQIVDTVGLNIKSPFGYDGQVKTILAMTLIWLNFSAFTALTTFPFFEGKVKYIGGIVKYYASAVYMATLLGMGLFLQALDGAEALETISVRGILLALETGVALGECVYYNVKSFKIDFSYKNLIFGVLVVLGMIVVSVPSYAVQVYFGDGFEGVDLRKFTFYHRLVIYLTLIIPIIISILFFKKDKETRRYALLYLSLAAMHSYSHIYTLATFPDVAHWPLHLCNTAMYIVPLCLMFKLDRVFYFTLFINVLGAFFAILMPNYGLKNYTSVDVVNFWINHCCAFFMPILLIAFRLYDRPKGKHFTYSLIAFAVYFLIILVIDSRLVGKADFFFLNDDFIVKKLGSWAENLRNVTLSFTVFGSEMKFYPLYQALFFLVYVALAFAMWFLYVHCFKLADTYYEVAARNRKIKADKLALEVALNGRSEEEPMNLETADKLVLRNFSKKYSTSKTFAVQDANLEIQGGQIFGFLGPNGAGKSTIIKSIVGIQTITSGSIEVCGYDVEKQSVMAKKQIGFVPDHYALYENLTGREYVNYIADLYNVSKEEREARIDEYVRIFNLEKSFDSRIKTYSHGMKQKITIMSALVHNPRLWILDEPLTGLDPESIYQVKECMKKHAREGNIVFFSSHLIDIVQSLCDRIAIIREGHILLEADVNEIENSGVSLEDFYMNAIGEVTNDD